MSIQKILVLEENPLYRLGIKAFLEREFLATITIPPLLDLPSVISYGEKSCPHLLVIDIFFSSMGGLELIRTWRKYFCEIPILVVSEWENISVLEKLLYLGIRGFHPKKNPLKELYLAIQLIDRGEIYLPLYLNTQILERVFTPSSSEYGGSGLTEREVEILIYLSKGFGPREIGEVLQISPHTVESHRRHLRKKLGLRDAKELYRFAENFQSHKIIAF